MQWVVNKSKRSNAQNSEYRQQNCVVILKLATKLDLNYSNHWKEMIIPWRDSSAAVAIMLHYINISNQHVVHLEFNQRHMSNIFQIKKKERKKITLLLYKMSYTCRNFSSEPVNYSHSVLKSLLVSGVTMLDAYFNDQREF